MPVIKVDLKDAEKVKQKLMEEGVFDPSYRVRKEGEFLLVPVNEDVEGFEKVDVKLEKVEENATLRDALQGKLSEEELDSLKTAFDTVGEIAILEIDEGLRKKDKIIAETLLEINPAIGKKKKKDEKHEGTFRTQKLKFLAGKETKEAEHKENNVRLLLDVEKVYFSPRLSTERKRIMQLVEKGEEVLVMFSGCGSYTCVIAKNTEAERVVGVEINPAGHEYAEKNKRINKLKNVENHCGDVKDVVPELGKFDRVLMPLPMNAEDFLDIALGAAKKGAKVHFYDFLEEKDIPDAAIGKIRKACPKAEILDHVKCGQFAPRTYRVCVDFRV